MAEHPSPWLSESEWSLVQRTVPIVCVEAVPSRRVDGIAQIGLILRANPFGAKPIWCQIGGRVVRNEVITEALHRHINDSVHLDVDFAVDPQPGYVMQYLPSGATKRAHWAGTDPRKHSISLCYLISVDSEITWRSGGEALDFQWFAVTELPDLEPVWPGTKHLVQMLVSGASP